MNKLTYYEYKAMCNTIGRSTSNVLHSAVQAAFGSVSDVTGYYKNGLVSFTDGSKWIYNFNKRYPTFYKVFPFARNQPFIKAY